MIAFLLYFDAGFALGVSTYAPIVRNGLSALWARLKSMFASP